MSLASLLKRGSEREDEKPFICLYGAPDVGKTSLAAQFPGVCFVRAGDVGVTELQRSGLVDESIPSTDLLTDYDQVEAFLTAVAEAPNDERPKAVCFDGLGGVTELISRRICNIDFKGDRMKFGAYNKGVERCVPVFQDFVARCNSLRSKGVVPLYLAHAQTVEDVNPLGDSFLKLCPRLHKAYLAVLEQECPNIGYMCPTVVTDEDGLRTKAKNNTGRPPVFLHFVGTPAMTAKTKMGITQPIPMGNSAKEGFANLVNAIQSAKKTKESA